MASEDEKVAISLPVRQTLVPTTAPFALCFAFSFYFFLIQNLNSPLALAIKLANGVIQATSTLKYLKSPSPSFATLFFASKLVIKGFKISQRLIPTGVVVGPTPSPIAARKLKACVAAINILRLYLLVIQPEPENFNKRRSRKFESNSDKDVHCTESNNLHAVILFNE